MRALLLALALLAVCLAPPASADVRVKVLDWCVEYEPGSTHVDFYDCDPLPWIHAERV